MDWMEEVADKMRRKWAAARGRARGARPRGRNRRGDFARPSRRRPPAPRRSGRAAMGVGFDPNAHRAARNSRLSRRGARSRFVCGCRASARRRPGMQRRPHGGPCARPAHLRADRARSRMRLERQPKGRRTARPRIRRPPLPLADSGGESGWPMGRFSEMTDFPNTHFLQIRFN